MVSKVFGGEDLRLFGFLERAIYTGDVGDVVIREFLALFTQGFTHPLEKGGRIDQLHLVLASALLLVRQHPDVGENSGVVKHLIRQRDDRFQPVVLKDPTADL